MKCYGWQLLLMALYVTAATGTASATAYTRAALWESDIAAFEESDLVMTHPEKGRILFIGSSSIRMWHSLEQDFPGYNVMNRGFGGSWISDSTHFINRIVLPYAPEVIILYAGENDLAAGLPAGQVAADFERFVGEVRRALGDVHIAFISMKPSPSRWALADQKREGNRLIEDITRTSETLSFINVFDEMLGPDGSPQEELFVGDRLHMNETGYAIWTAIVNHHLRQIAQ